MKLKPVAMSLSQAEIDEIATELLEATQPDWQNAISMTPSTLPYTMPSDGIFIGRGISATSGSITIYINGVNVSDTNSGYTNFQVSVKKNDIARMTGSLAGGGFTFVPYKTMNPVSLRPLDPHKIDTAILNHWDDITSDFSTAGSSAGFVLDRAVYNPILRKLRVNFHITNSFAAGTNKHFFLIYNGSDLPAFTRNCMYSSCLSSDSVSASVGFEDSYTISPNKVDMNIYNRNDNTAWAAGASFTTQIEF